MIRVFHFAQDADTSGFFPQLARFHDRTRFEMTFGTLGTTAPELRAAMEAEGVRVTSLGARGRRDYPRALARLVSELRTARPDVLHTHLFDPSAVGLVAGAIARVPVRVMTRHHTDLHQRLGKPLHVAVDRATAAMAHHVVAVSEHTRRTIVEREGTPPRKVTTIHNGIDLTRVEPPSEGEVHALRVELGIERSVVVTVVARLHPDKGHDVLLDALALLRDEIPPVVVLLAGEGPHREALERRAASLGPSAHLRFLGFRKDIARLYAAADLVVLPSQNEAFGLVLPEAMALHRPVLATAVGGIPEIVEHGVTGWLVEPGSAAAMASALKTLLLSPDLRRRLGARSSSPSFGSTG